MLRSVHGGNGGKKEGKKKEKRRKKMETSFIALPPFSPREDGKKQRHRRSDPKIQREDNTQIRQLFSTLS